MKYKLLPSLFSDFDTFLRPMATDYFLDEDSTGYTLSIDMPGIKKNDLAIETNNGSLTIKAESKTKGRSRSYQRTFKLPEMVKADAIEAELMDGILQVRMPKTEERRPKLVQIK